MKYFSSLSDVCVLCEIQLSTEQWYEMMMSTILGLHHTGPHSTMVTGHISSTTPGESVCWHHQTISSLSVTNHCSVEAGDQWSQDKARLWSQVSVWWWWPGLTPVSHLTLLTTAHWKLTIFRNHLIFITSITDDNKLAHDTLVSTANINHSSNNILQFHVNLSWLVRSVYGFRGKYLLSICCWACSMRWLSLLAGVFKLSIFDTM